MSWKESSVTDERMRFVIRLKDIESMASLCGEFGTARKIHERLLRRLPHGITVPAQSPDHLIEHPRRDRLKEN